MVPAPASNMAGFNMSMFAGLGSSAPVVPYEPLLIKNDPEFAKYFKLQQMGMPAEQIKLKMSAEKHDPTVLDRPDDVSPNDPGVSGREFPLRDSSCVLSSVYACICSHQPHRQHHQVAQYRWSSYSVFSCSTSKSSSKVSSSCAYAGPCVFTNMSCHCLFSIK